MSQTTKIWSGSSLSRNWASSVLRAVESIPCLRVVVVRGRDHDRRLRRVDPVEGLLVGDGRLAAARDDHRLEPVRPDELRVVVDQVEGDRLDPLRCAGECLLGREPSLDRRALLLRPVREHRLEELVQRGADHLELRKPTS
jgi:hypothetical protein